MLMNTPVNTTMQNNHAFVDRTYFIRVFAVLCVLLTSFLFAIDFVPELRVEAQQPTAAPASTTSMVSEEYALPDVLEQSTPVRIRIAAIGVDTPVVTPQSTDIPVLDRALLSGAVLYPGSAEAGQKGNMLIFGHSSYLPVVKNKSFQAFNELGKLEKGERIEVLSETHRYEYAVDSVTLVSADDTSIPLTTTEARLTLATCNAFGAKQERWVVTSHLVQKEPLR